MNLPRGYDPADGLDWPVKGADAETCQRFGALVAEYEETDSILAQEWAGRLTDGQFFYFRYKNGEARLGLGTDPGSAVADESGLTRALTWKMHSAMNAAQVRRVIVELYEARSLTDLDESVEMERGLARLREGLARLRSDPREAERIRRLADLAEDPAPGGGTQDEEEEQP